MINTLVFWTILFLDGTVKEVYTDPGVNNDKPVGFYTYIKGSDSRLAYIENPYKDISGTLPYIWELKND